jgi:hypothetical protein
MLSKEEFINREVSKSYICEDVRTLNKKLSDGEKVIYTKYGDGEYQCMSLQHIGSTNCDKDRYTYELGIELRKSFCNLCDRSEKENIFIGKWHTEEVFKFCCNLLYDYYISNNKELKPVPFVNYHFCQVDYNYNKNNNLLEFVRTIKNANKIKIIISNIRNKKLGLIFNGYYFIEIPENSWFANGYYNKLEENLINLLNVHNDAIVLIAGGLASKVIIANVSSKFENASFIDIGSSFDILASKIITRAWGKENEDFPNNYENQLIYFKDILPENYDNI